MEDAREEEWHEGYRVGVEEVLIDLAVCADRQGRDWVELFWLVTEEMGLAPAGRARVRELAQRAVKERGRGMAEDIVRVLRIVEYVGPRSEVEAQIRQSLHGSRIGQRSVLITAATIGDFPEILDEARKEFYSWVNGLAENEATRVLNKAGWTWNEEERQWYSPKNTVWQDTLKAGEDEHGK